MSNAYEEELDKILIAIQDNDGKFNWAQLCVPLGYDMEDEKQLADLFPMLAKLEKDGHITTYQSFYQLTFEAKIFIKDGGYVGIKYREGIQYNNNNEAIFLSKTAIGISIAGVIVSVLIALFLK